MLDKNQAALRINRLIASEDSLNLMGEDTESYLVARRKDADSPWLAVNNHELAELTAPIIDDYLRGQIIAGAEAKSLVEKPLINAILKQALPLIQNKIQEFKNSILNFENKSVVKLFNNEKEKINEVTSDLIAWQTLPVLVLLPEEAKLLKNYVKVLNNYPECFTKAKKYARIAVDLFNAYESNQDLSGESQELVENIQTNCELFQEVLTRHVRQLPENPELEKIKKVFSEHAPSSVEDLTAKLIS